jgi:hypothetical protein
MQKTWRKFVYGKDGTPVMWQRPNLALILWFVFSLSAHFIHANPWHRWLSGAGAVSLALWALLELIWGASYFRRTLGGLVLAYTILTRLFG